MTKFEIETRLQEVGNIIVESMDIMSSSDGHALECIKLGKDFKKDYAKEYTDYENALTALRAAKTEEADLLQKLADGDYDDESEAGK